MRIINSSHKGRGVAGKVVLSVYALIPAGTFEWACKTVVTSNRLAKPRRGIAGGKRESEGVLRAKGSHECLAVSPHIPPPPLPLLTRTPRFLNRGPG